MINPFRRQDAGLIQHHSCARRVDRITVRPVMSLILLLAAL